MKDKYQENVDKLLISLESDQVIVVREVAKTNPKLFITCCKNFIDNNPDYEFNSKYDKIRRIKLI